MPSASVVDDLRDPPGSARASRRGGSPHRRRVRTPRTRPLLRTSAGSRRTSIRSDGVFGRPGLSTGSISSQALLSVSVQCKRAHAGSAGRPAWLRLPAGERGPTPGRALAGVGLGAAEEVGDGVADLGPLVGRHRAAEDDVRQPEGEGVERQAEGDLGDAEGVQLVGEVERDLTDEADGRTGRRRPGWPG